REPDETRPGTPGLRRAGSHCGISTHGLGIGRTCDVGGETGERAGDEHGGFLSGSNAGSHLGSAPVKTFTLGVTGSIAPAGREDTNPSGNGFAASAPPSPGTGAPAGGEGSGYASGRVGAADASGWPSGAWNRASSPRPHA